MSNETTERPKCSCTFEAGDSHCDAHPTCPKCGSILDGFWGRVAARATNEAADLRAEIGRLKSLGSAVVANLAPHVNGDWACAECRPTSDMLVAGFRCNLHAFIAAVSGNEGRRVDDETRCAVCAWPLADSIERGCTRGNCSHRPRPDRLYAPERAAKESHTKAHSHGG